MWRNSPACRQYRKLWMQNWRREYRAKHLDKRANNGKNQIRHSDGKFSVSKDDIR